MDYAENMVSLRSKLELLDRMLRDKAPAAECRPVLLEMMNALARVGDYLKTQP